MTSRMMDPIEGVEEEIRGLVRTARSVRIAEERIKTTFSNALVWVQAWGEHTFAVLIKTESAVNNVQIICPRERATTIREHRRVYSIGHRRRRSRAFWKRDHTSPLPRDTQFIRVIDCEVVDDDDGHLRYTGRTREWLDLT